jgi:hypothetical protein
MSATFSPEVQLFAFTEREIKVEGRRSPSLCNGPSNPMKDHWKEEGVDFSSGSVVPERPALDHIPRQVTSPQKKIMPTKLTRKEGKRKRGWGTKNKKKANKSPSPQVHATKTYMRGYITPNQTKTTKVQKRKKKKYRTNKT